VATLPPGQPTAGDFHVHFAVVASATLGVGSSLGRGTAIYPGEFTMSEESAIRKLNEQYLRAYMTADVGWYAQHLAESFVCTKPDGSVVDRSEFLRQIAEGPDVTEYRLERVRVRLEGDTAAVDGTGSFTCPDGTKGTSRYTDVYRRVTGEWSVISAQIARTLHPKPAGAS